MNTNLSFIHWFLNYSSGETGRKTSVKLDKIIFNIPSTGVKNWINSIYYNKVKIISDMVPWNITRAPITSLRTAGATFKILYAWIGQINRILWSDSIKFPRLAQSPKIVLIWSLNWTINKIERKCQWYRLFHDCSPPTRAST